ncbi:MAG: AbrB/MazE/SpoVT family DNA-binding domain-containing protein [Pseudomonadota bacterium]|nr:AbrB/MazE/SpoVT family DNA-binding domain-containing protein [Pseudomonadota bacterium]
MPHEIVGRWGKMLAVRLPAEVARAARFRGGERVEVTHQNEDILIRKSAQGLAVDDLFRGKTPRAWRELYAGAYDWGTDRGREIVEE